MIAAAQAPRFPTHQKLASNMGYALAGNATYALCQWFMLVVLAKLGSVQMVGEFAFGLALAAPVFLLSGMQTRAVQVTDTASAHDFSDFLSLRVVSSAAAFLVVAGIAFFGYSGERACVVAAVAAVKAFESVSDVYHGDLQSRERMDWISRWLVLKGVASVVVLGLIVRLTGSLAWGALGVAGVFGSVLLFGEALLAAPGAKLRWNPVEFGRIVAVALPLGIVMMMISLNTNLPRYFLEHSHGSGSLGILAALTYLGFAGNTVMGAVGQAATPRLARLYASQDHQGFHRLVRQMLSCGLLLATGLVGVMIIAGKPILNLVYGPEYAARIDVAVWMVAAAGISYLASALGYAMTAARSFKPQLPLFAAVTFVTAVASAYWIPRYGLAGAAVVQVVSAGTQLFGAACLVAMVLRQSRTTEMRRAEMAA